MSMLLIRNALLVATMDDEGRELRHCDILADGSACAAVGHRAPAP